MKQNRKAWWILEFTPLLLLWLYVLFTLIMFRFGLIQWKVPHIGLVIFYVLLIYVSFSVGYTLWLRKYKKKEQITISLRGEKFFQNAMTYLFRIGAFISIIHAAAWLNQVFGFDIFRFLKSPGAAYDLSNFMSDLYATGITPYPMWFRWISRFSTLLGGVKVTAVCIGTYKLRDFQIPDKILFFTMLALDLLYAWMFGKQSLFVILALQIFISGFSKYASEVYAEKNEKSLFESLQKNRKVLLGYAFFLLFVLISILALIMFMQDDRAIQRNIRKDLYFETVEKTGNPPPVEQLEYFVLESVQERTGYSIKNPALQNIITKKYGEYIKKDPINNPEHPTSPGINPTPAGPGNTHPSTTPTKPTKPATLQENFVGLSKFYETAKWSMLPGGLSYGLQSLEMYVTQGYASMALAFDLDFQWSKFVGNSIYISHLVDRLFRTAIADQTYTARNETVNGWSESVYFNTLYTWLASDVSFLGVIVLFFFGGAFFAKVWIEVIDRRFLFALPVCYQFAYGLIFAPTNNSLFNTLSEIIKTLAIICIYLCGLFFCKLYKENQPHPPRKLAFIIGNLEIGGAAKMLTYVANISTKFFDDVSIFVLRRNSDMYQLNPGIKVVELNLSFQKKGTLHDYYTRWKELHQALLKASPDIIMAFVNPIIIYSYFAKPKDAILIGADRGNPKALPKLHRILSYFVYPRCNKLVFQTDGALNCFRRINSKSSIIENPFIVNGDDPGVYRGIRKKTIVSTSRLDEGKNVDVLIRAFAESKAAHDYTLQIFGDGPSKETLKNLTKELGLTENVIFMGTVKNIMQEICDAGIFVLVSNDEGMPNGLIEAMALGIPCITTNCMAGNTNSLVKHGENGLIVKIGDVEELTNAINTYCTDIHYRQMLGLNGSKIRETLNEAVIRQKWDCFFRNLQEEAL